MLIYLKVSRTTWYLGKVKVAISISITVNIRNMMNSVEMGSILIANLSTNIGLYAKRTMYQDHVIWKPSIIKPVVVTPNSINNSYSSMVAISMALIVDVLDQT